MASNSIQAPKPPQNWEGLGPYLKGVREELKKAIWPTRPELIQMTQVVIALIVVMAVFSGGLDYLLSRVTGVLFR